MTAVAMAAAQICQMDGVLFWKALVLGCGYLLAPYLLLVKMTAQQGLYCWVHQVHWHQQECVQMQEL